MENKDGGHGETNAEFSNLLRRRVTGFSIRFPAAPDVLERTDGGALQDWFMKEFCGTKSGKRSNIERDPFKGLAGAVNCHNGNPVCRALDQQCGVVGIADDGKAEFRQVVG